MIVLITGATGFVGGSVTRNLLARGAQVRILARSAARAAILAENGADVQLGDVTDRDAVRAAVEGVDIVYNLAGKLFTPGAPVAEYRRVHVEGTQNLLASCLEQPGIIRFVHVSTTGVLGRTGNHPADEETPFAPTNAYEATKCEAEGLVRAAHQHGLPTVIARPSLIYGPGDLHLLGFFRAIQRGLFRQIGREPVWLHPIYVDDLAEALVRCAEHPRAVGECFHLAGQQPVSISTLAATIADALGVAAPRGTIPLLVARAVAVAGDLLPARLRLSAPLTSSRLDFLTHSRIYEVTKAQRLLDFVAPTDLSTGIEQTVGWYRQQSYLPSTHSRTNVIAKQAKV